jgi:Lon-like ATP-dependent protease
VSWYSEVFDLLFADLDKDQARQLWKQALAKPAGKQAAEAEE